MVAETHRDDRYATDPAPAPPLTARSWSLRRAVLPLRWLLGGFRQASLSSLTRRILILNMVALVALVGGILYLNQFRAGLTDARVDSLLTQGQIIAAAIAAQATVDTDAITINPDRLLELEAGESVSPFDVGEGAADFPINPERVAPLLKRLVTPTRTRARLYDQDGTLLLDSQGLYSRGQILRFTLPAPNARKSWTNILMTPLRRLFQRSDLSAYYEIGAGNGREYPEVESALNGGPASVVRISEDGGLIVSVAVPVQRFRAVLGGLLLSTESGDIDAIVQAERMAIFRVFLVAAGVTILLSFFLASTIAGPVRRLSGAADQVRRGVRYRVEIPEFAKRKDEIGDLARSLKDMTEALYYRMDTIERFAADVAHELKNPLTSLRSAVETLPIVRTGADREKLMAIIQHDVRRLDRLISDISDASRLDAELAREDTAPFDLSLLLETVIEITRETPNDGRAKILLAVKRGRFGKDAFIIRGHDSRMGQVVSNLLDNALSFSPEGGTVRITAARNATRIALIVEDEGPGIPADQADRIFERFYTDRPGSEDFGQNSGLGLAISRQIIEAHRGTITAENRIDDTGRIVGACFTILLPAIP
ncbi:MAG: stimulus-sensing domain-containing protein [Alphaproteobacteria bacterium]